MSTVAPPRAAREIRLKDPSGWFAAGPSFREAVTLLSDGAFKLFVYICLQADRKTGRFIAGQKELAAAIGKSKRIIGRYVGELQAKGVCSVAPARNQHAATSFEIRDAFWPYHRAEHRADPHELRQYIESLQTAFLGLGCTNGNFGAAEAAAARDLYRRQIPLGIVDEAMLLAGCRKYCAWLNGQVSGPIQSLKYFEPVIAEVQRRPLPPGYSGYLRQKLKKFAEAWEAQESRASVAVGTPKTPDSGGSEVWLQI